MFLVSPKNSYFVLFSGGELNLCVFEAVETFPIVGKEEFSDVKWNKS